jgi:hypothetical protein
VVGSWSDYVTHNDYCLEPGWLHLVEDSETLVGSSSLQEHSCSGILLLHLK